MIATHPDMLRTAGRSALAQTVPALGFYRSHALHGNAVPDALRPPQCGVIKSIDSWQLCRTTRNLAAHDYETDYAEIAEHFNALHDLLPLLYGNASRFISYCGKTLDVSPRENDFSDGFNRAIEGSV